MDNHRAVQMKPRAAKSSASDLEATQGVRASAAETAEYLAQMASELVTMARTAGLERLSLLLDFVRREAEAEAESSAA
jgi:hypothetical protein